MPKKYYLKNYWAHCSKFKKKELRVLSFFHHNHNSLSLYGLFLLEVQAKKAAKTAQKVQVNYGYGETKRICGGKFK